LAGKIGIKYFETSAKTGHNVKELFQQIATDLLSFGGLVFSPFPTQFITPTV
jgi:GTPase SAR1 family protein